MPKLNVSGTGSAAKSRSTADAQSLGHEVRTRARRRVGQQQRELLAAGAGDRVAGATAGGEDAPDAHEHGVAGAVAELVVDGLEVVEVADDDGQPVSERSARSISTSISCSSASLFFSPVRVSVRAPPDRL